jgi:excisionase family DNA binding protein
MREETQPAQPDVDDTVTPSWGLAEAAAFLRAHPDTVRKLAKDRRIPAAKIGKAWVFMPHLLAEYLEQQCRTQQRRFDIMKSGGLTLAERLRADRQARIANRSSD